MVTVVRLLFGVCALVFFFIVGLFAAKGVARRMNDPNVGHILNIAYLVNTVLLVVFFTLWCVKAGVL